MNAPRPIPILEETDYADWHTSVTDDDLLDRIHEHVQEARGEFVPRDWHSLIMDGSEMLEDEGDLL